MGNPLSVNVTTSLLSPDDPRWSAFLRSGPHDFYHLPAFVTLSARTSEPTSPVAVLVEDGERSMLLPLLLREIPGEPGRRDATSPYGYASPLLRGSGSREPDFVACATQRMVDALGAEGVISLFVRMHPLLDLDPAGFKIGSLLRQGETVVVDLSETEEVQWRGIRPGHRREISRSLRAGHEAVIDQGWDHVDDFIRLYTATMRRVGASRLYFFDADYLCRLREALGNQLHLSIVRIEGAVAAAGLFTEVSGIVQYHLSGSDNAFARERPTKLMLNHVRQWATRRGNRWLHLGGGVGAQPDSLFRFKAGFSRHRRSFYSWRVVIDQPAYSALVGARHSGAYPADVAGHFPAYRGPC